MRLNRLLDDVIRTAEPSLKGGLKVEIQQEGITIANGEEQEARFSEFKPEPW